MNFLWFLLFVSFSVLFVNGPNIVLPRKIMDNSGAVLVSYVVCAAVLVLLCCFIATRNYA
jgi:hypothetical protein